ncbi:MAG: hypothetical protein LBB61_03695 [Treponema sp.]|nr:hypothetical protein [Treponema sp.]
MKGKVLLIVNPATGCGFTPQYTGLQKLYKEINTFCTLKYHTTFPCFAKIEVNGQNESPLYRY